MTSTPAPTRPSVTLTRETTMSVALVAVVLAGAFWQWTQFAKFDKSIALLSTNVENNKDSLQRVLLRVDSLTGQIQELRVNVATLQQQRSGSGIGGTNNGK